MPNRYLKERMMSKHQRDGRRGGERRGTHVRGHYRDYNDGRGSDYGRNSGSDYGRGQDYGRGRSDYGRGQDYGRRGVQGGNPGHGNPRLGDHRDMRGQQGMMDQRRQQGRYTDPRNTMRMYNMPRHQGQDYNDYNDYNDYRNYNDYGDYNDYDDYNDYGDYNDYNDYNDYGDYNDYANEEEEYKKDLKEWIKKLKSKDKFGISEREIIEKAKSMGVSFGEYSEEEYIATYYIMMSIFPNVGNDVHMYLAMAKSFLEYKDVAVSPSDLICIYMYKIVKGE